jgi:very-short-patch-repair endonuclease
MANDSTPTWQKRSLFPFWNLPKNIKLFSRARELRKQGILSEVIFWKNFKNKEKIGWDIDRQVVIGNFIVDFFIPELGLVFEIDGASHNEKEIYDSERDSILAGHDLEIVRIRDRDVLENIDYVWDYVVERIESRVAFLKVMYPPLTPQEGNKIDKPEDNSPLEGCPKGGVDE